MGLEIVDGGMRWTIALLITLLIPPVSTVSAVSPEDPPSLADSLEVWVTRLEKDDLKAATDFARDAGAARAVRDRWDQLKKCHADYDYRRWLDANPETKGAGARRIGDATEFTVGGHAYGHVHVRWEKTDGGWKVADVWLCR